MKKSKFRKVLSSVLVSILFLSIAIGSVYGVDPIQDWSAEMTRFSGENRYQTSAIVSTYLFDSSDYVVLARGDELGNYADALAGSYLAGFRNAPLLLTRPNFLPESIQAEILRLNPSKAYILGGVGAIHPAVEDTLKSMGLEVERLSGSRREETAVAIVDYVRDHSIRTTREIDNFAFIINGRATADALVAGSYAYEHQIPILLVNQDSLPAVTGAALNSYSFDYLTLIGGSGVISADLEGYLDSMYTVGQRIAGARRYETSVAFAEAMFPKANHFVFVAGPNVNLADGISAASLGLPILFVGNNAIPSVLSSYLSTHLSAFSHLFVLGGSTAISQSVATGLEAIQQALPPMITFAYIENEGGDYTLYADIDNVHNQITLTFAPGRENDQYVDGYSNLSKAVFLEISGTDEGKYDLPAGRLVEPEEDFVELILDLFTDTPPLGVNGQTLLANSGAIFTLTEKDNSANVRVYTLIVNTQDF